MCCFFQAEDGIRDIGVTGVQTCALPISRQMLADTDAFTMEVMHVLADGRRIYVDTNTHTWYDENGAVIGLLAVNRNTTESKQAEETIRATNQKLTAILTRRRSARARRSKPPASPRTRRLPPSGS